MFDSWQERTGLKQKWNAAVKVKPKWHILCVHGEDIKHHEKGICNPLTGGAIEVI
jgi:hypothetical protein